MLGPVSFRLPSGSGVVLYGFEESFEQLLRDSLTQPRAVIHRVAVVESSVYSRVLDFIYQIIGVVEDVGRMSDQAID